MAKGFKFEKFWIQDESCFGLVADVWRQKRAGSPAWVLFQKIRAVKGALRLWNKQVFGNIHLSLQAMKDQLQCYQEAEPTSQNLWMELCLILELDEQLRREKMLWKQKSRVSWLSSSDLNTKFFHASTVIRRCRNQIVELKKGSEEWISGRSSLGNELVEFYSALYKSKNSDIPSDLENLVSVTITEDKNA